MRDVNLERLRALAGQLRSAVRELEDYGRLTRELFLADRRTINSAKYLLIVAAEAALDICNHLAARRGGRSPEDYAHGGRQLSQERPAVGHRGPARVSRAGSERWGV